MSASITQSLKRLSGSLACWADATVTTKKTLTLLSWKVYYISRLQSLLHRYMWFSTAITYVFILVYVSISLLSRSPNISNRVCLKIKSWTEKNWNENCFLFFQAKLLFYIPKGKKKIDDCLECENWFTAVLLLSNKVLSINQIEKFEQKISIHVFQTFSSWKVLIFSKNLVSLPLIFSVHPVIHTLKPNN